MNTLFAFFVVSHGVEAPFSALLWVPNPKSIWLAFITRECCMWS